MLRVSLWRLPAAALQDVGHRGTNEECDQWQVSWNGYASKGESPVRVLNRPDHTFRLASSVHRQVELLGIET